VSAADGDDLTPERIRMRIRVIARLALRWFLGAGVGAVLLAAAPANALAITEPPCSGPGSIAFYGGPPLPLRDSGDGFYESNPTYTVPAGDEGAWPTSTPEAQGMNAADLQNGISWLHSRYPILRSVLIARNGYLVDEQYFNGRGDSGGVGDANNIHSGSKSIMQALIAIAIQKGYISGLNARVSQYLPSYFNGLSSTEKSITIADMLDMQSGLEWTEGTTEEQKIQITSNWVQAILDQGMASQPGTGNFNYSTGNFDVLSAMLTAATGMSTCQFAENYLFGPLGIYPAHWGQDPTTGIDMGGCDLYMTPRDYLTFAQLYLQNGVWNGQQLLPASAVTQAATPTHDDGGGFDYDSGWWSRTLKHVPMKGVPMFMAWGWKGQFAYVIPSLNVVMVTTENSEDHSGALVELNSGDFIRHFLIPSIGS
jgi:CubicO group peptidase (beta-lactamase class C family)